MANEKQHIKNMQGVEQVMNIELYNEYLNNHDKEMKVKNHLHIDIIHKCLKAPFNPYLHIKDPYF
jgi:hypothetical protein